jgi:hypothetical protein
MEMGGRGKKSFTPFFVKRSGQGFEGKRGMGEDGRVVKGGGEGKGKGIGKEGQEKGK